MTNKETIEVLVREELEAMNKKHADTNPVTFNTLHEGYAVLKEEVEEANAEMEGAFTCVTNRIWNCVKDDNVNKYNTYMQTTKEYAIRAIQELVQVCACCDKAVYKDNKCGVSDIINVSNNSTGMDNLGCYNSGDHNTGSFNVGSRNSGSYNIGNWNSGNHNTGCFNTIDTKEYCMFNKPCNIAMKDIDFPSCLYFELTKWICVDDVTEKERVKYAKEIEMYNSGFLKKYTYKRAFGMSWKEATDEEKEAVKKLPNFDADIFYKISGIKI